MKTVRHNESIVEIENFLDDKMINRLINFVTNSETNWWGEFNGFVGRVATLPKDIEEELTKNILNCFEYVDVLTPVGTIARYVKGLTFGAHKDNIGSKRINFGIILYPVDDYEGGYLVYPELNLKIKPKAGSMVIHTGEVVHEVTAVTNDKLRYIITAFAHGSETRPAVVKPEYWTDNVNE